MSATSDAKMGSQPVNKLIFGMALPPMVSMTMQALYNLVDSAFLAMVSEEALAAVTLVYPIQMLQIAVTGGTGVGLASLISRRLGQGRRKDAGVAAAHGIALAFVIWGAYLLFGVFLAGPFLAMYADPHAEPEIYRMALLYCRFVTIGGLPGCFLVFSERILQSTGNMIFPMIISITGAVINMILAPIFIIGYFGVPGFGVAGAGGVMVFGMSIAAAIGLLILFRGKHAIRMEFKGFKMDRHVVKDILVVGAPSIMVIAISSFMTSGLNMILMSFSSAAVAVCGAYFRIQTFVLLPINGLNQGALPVMAYNFGANNKLRLLAAYKTTLKAAVAILVVGFALFWIFPDRIMMIFSATGDFFSIGVYALRIISLHFLLAGFTIASISLFQATAHAIFALVISVVRQLVFLLPAAYLLATLSGADGVYAVWYAFPIAELAAFTMTLVFFRKINKGEISRLPDGAPAA